MEDNLTLAQWRERALVAEELLAQMRAEDENLAADMAVMREEREKQPEPADEQRRKEPKFLKEYGSGLFEEKLRAVMETAPEIAPLDRARPPEPPEGTWAGGRPVRRSARVDTLAAQYDAARRELAGRADLSVR